jgi:hypothetical protein
MSSRLAPWPATDYSRASNGSARSSAKGDKIHLIWIIDRVSGKREEQAEIRNQTAGLRRRVVAELGRLSWLTVAGEAFSVHQNSLWFFWNQSLRIVFDGFSPISLTIINKMDYIHFIQLRLLIFEISCFNIRLLKREGILATRLRRAGLTGTFLTWSPNFSRSVMKIKMRLPGNYSKHHVIYIRNRNVCISFISRDYISLQAPCQMVVNRSAWLESSLSRSLASNIQIHFIYLTCHISLTLLIFITFCALDNVVTYRRSKRVIKVGAFDRSNFGQWGNVDILISSKKIKIILPVNYSKSKCFRFLPYSGTKYFCEHPVRLSLGISLGSDGPFCAPLYLMPGLTKYI